MRAAGALILILAGAVWPMLVGWTVRFALYPGVSPQKRADRLAWAAVWFMLDLFALVTLATGVWDS